MYGRDSALDRDLEMAIIMPPPPRPVPRATTLIITHRTRKNLNKIIVQNDIKLITRPPRDISASNREARARARLRKVGGTGGVLPNSIKNAAIYSSGASL